jgi:hypothetical protein
MEIASLLLSLFAVLLAGASAFYTMRQANYTRRQADEAAKVRVIEEGRLHTELTPQITLVGKARDAEGKSAEVVLELTGPNGLERLDRVQVRIRDDMPRKPTPAGVLQVTEHWDEVIWGPYRIKSGLRDTDAYGRAHGPFPLPKNEPYPVPLEESIAPPWQTDWQSWRDQYRGAPVRLEITCFLAPHGPWVLTREIEVRLPGTPTSP